MPVQPFHINIDPAILDDLHERLARTRWTDQIDGAGWDYGTELGYLQELIAYWRDQFDWRAQEAMLNRFHHFRAEIDGLGIHFIHERGAESKLPLILTHGWPDSFYRFYKLIPLLTDSFDVIVPSIPGYGFSDIPRERGLNSKVTAELWFKLMTELGYARFGAVGGDIGSGISRFLALAHPEQVVAIHLTDLGTAMPPTGELSDAEQRFIGEVQQWSADEGAYGSLHRTKPQTLAYGLNDSPVGLAAWIIEKFRSWSDCDGEIERRYSKDELLTNLTIYWATQTINSSVRIYYENRLLLLKEPARHIDVPVGFALFPKDLLQPPREWVERTANVQRWTKMPRGGHFAALEEPELYADDIRVFFRQFR
ncbi:MAG TPA: epoxide hydrolase [Phototrophicaceae bacterium]|nr:epoxide hydrolase [Phototrophicaceae bacterium]